MSKNTSGAIQHQVSHVSSAAKSIQAKHQQQARELFDSFNKGDPQAVALFLSKIPEANKVDFRPSLLQARMLVAGDGLIVKRLSLEKLKKEANERLKELKLNLPDALERRDRYNNKQVAELKLADAQFIIARENGLPS